MEEVRKLPARLALLPLVETVGRDQTPIAGKRVLECCARGCGFRPGVDMPGPDLGVLGEPGNQPPAKRTETTLPIVLRHRVHPIGRRNIPRRFERLIE